MDKVINELIVGSKVADECLAPRFAMVVGGCAAVWQRGDFGDEPAEVCGILGGVGRFQ